MTTTSRSLDLPYFGDTPGAINELRDAVFAAHTFHETTLIRVGHNEAVLLSKEDYEELKQSCRD